MSFLTPWVHGLWYDWAFFIAGIIISYAIIAATLHGVARAVLYQQIALEEQQCRTETAAQIDVAASFWPLVLIILPLAGIGYCFYYGTTHISNSIRQVCLKIAPPKEPVPVSSRRRR